MIRWVKKYTPEDWTARAYFLGLGVGFGLPIVTISVVLFRATRLPRELETALFILIPLWLIYWFIVGLGLITYWYERRRGDSQ